MTLKALQDLRETIDETDNKIVELLALRYRTVKEIGKLKKELNLSSMQKSRWDEVLEKVVSKGRKLELNQIYLTNIWNLIHEESLNAEEKIIKND